MKLRAFFKTFDDLLDGLNLFIVIVIDDLFLYKDISDSFTFFRATMATEKTQTTTEQITDRLDWTAVIILSKSILCTFYEKNCFQLCQINKPMNMQAFILKCIQFSSSCVSVFILVE